MLPKLATLELQYILRFLTIPIQVPPPHHQCLRSRKAQTKEPPQERGKICVWLYTRERHTARLCAYTKMCPPHGRIIILPAINFPFRSRRVAEIRCEQ